MTGMATQKQYDFLRILAKRNGYRSANEAAVALGIRSSLKSLNKGGLTKQQASDLINLLKDR